MGQPGHSLRRANNIVTLISIPVVYLVYQQITLHKLHTKLRKEYKDDATPWNWSKSALRDAIYRVGFRFDSKEFIDLRTPLLRDRAKCCIKLFHT